MAWQLAPETSLEAVASSMKVIDDLVVQVYASCDVVGIDAATGKPLWAAATKTHSEELVGVGDHILLGGTTTIDPKTGEVSDGDAEARATVLDGWALRGLSPVDRTLSITDLETGRTRELKAPWADDPELEPPSAPPDTPAVIDDVLYLAHRGLGRLYAIDLAAGQSLWANDLAAVGLDAMGPVIRTGSTLLACAVDANRRLGLVSVEQASGRFVGFHPFDPASTATTTCGSVSPQQAGELVIYGTSTTVWAVGSDGQAHWSYTGGRFSRLLVHEGRVFVGRIEDADLITLDSASGSVLHVEEAVPIERGSMPLVTSGRLIVVAGNGTLTALRSERLGVTPP